MSAIRACELPGQALLRRYTHEGCYTDCYAAEIEGTVTQAQYVEAFYTGGLFKLERLLLAWFASRPSTDAQARDLASGATDTFAAWRVEARGIDQMLLTDMSGRTRSWLMVGQTEGRGSTRLYFGSAVISETDGSSGRAAMGLTFRALLGFHKLYSRALLGAARGRLETIRNERRQ
jgi:hypothetical protein